MVLLFHTTYISVDLAHHKIFCAKVGKGDINRGSYTSTHVLLNSSHKLRKCDKMQCNKQNTTTKGT